MNDRRYTIYGKEYPVLGHAIYRASRWRSMPSGTPEEKLLKAYFNPDSEGIKDGRAYDIIRVSDSKKRTPKRRTPKKITIIVNGKPVFIDSTFFEVTRART